MFPQSNPLSSVQRVNRRHFLANTGRQLGALAAGALFTGDAEASRNSSSTSHATNSTHVVPRAKRVIYLFQSGAPSQIELFDHKPMLEKIAGQELPESIRRGQRLTTMTSGQSSFPIVPSSFQFTQRGDSGTRISELLPHIGSNVDDICIINSMYTEAINHDPAITFCQTGSQIAGRPSMGAWLAYGLGSINEDLPAYVVLISRGTGRSAGQPLYERLWGSGFLPTNFQGTKLRSGKDPVLFLSNPAGCSTTMRREMLDCLASLNQQAHEAFGDPEIMSRVEQYELAFRMQSSVPELTDIAEEPDHILDMYGPEVRKPGTYARNCLLARRLAERDVRFIQLYHMGWDQHNDLPDHLSKQCYDTDQASAALLKDLKQRGLLDDTLIVWGGEFGRAVYSQGRVTESTYGRDHHPRCYSVWLAGGGIKPGITYGETDNFSYNITNNPVGVHDLNATIMRLMGINHTQLTYRFQGRDFRLTDVHGEIVNGILA